MKSGMVDSLGIAVGIGAPSFAVQKLFSLPVLLAAILNFGGLSVLSNVDQDRQTSGRVLSVKSKPGAIENMGQPLESRRNLLPLKRYFQFRFGGRHQWRTVTFRGPGAFVVWGPLSIYSGSDLYQTLVDDSPIPLPLPSPPIGAPEMSPPDNLWKPEWTSQHFNAFWHIKTHHTILVFLLSFDKLNYTVSKNLSFYLYDNFRNINRF